jgi:protein-disulfide isomerase
VILQRFTRRLALGLALAAALGAGAAAAAIPAHEPDDMALGSPKAPVTVIEYASVGYPHCARWNNENFDAFKAKYVDTGRARLVVREMLTGDAAIAAAGFIIARCAGPAKYFPMVDAIYRRQAGMFQEGATPEAVLRDVAKTIGGFSDAAFNACMADQKRLAAVNARGERHHSADGVDSTPTFFVNGKQLEGEVTLAALGDAIAAAGHRR